MSFIGGKEERAVERKDCERAFASDKQPVHALTQRQRQSGGLGANDKDADSAIGDSDLRANAGQRSAEACAKTAQPFEPRLTTRRQRRRKPRDLERRRVIWLKEPIRAFARVGSAEHRRPDRIGPNDA